MFFVLGLWVGLVHGIRRGIEDPDDIAPAMLLAVAITCVSLGPGEREFSTVASIPLRPVTLFSGSSSLVRRLAFLPGAVLMIVLSAGAWVRVVQSKMQQWRG